MSAFITSKNNPKVNIVKGIVNKMRIGLTNKFSKTKTIATQIDWIKLSTLMPGSKLARSKTKKAVMRSLMSIGNELKFYKYGLNLFIPIQKHHHQFQKQGWIFGM